MNDIDKPFPGAWYADADRPSAPCARKMIKRHKEGLCVDCGHPVPTKDSWGCGKHGNCAGLGFAPSEATA